RADPHLGDAQPFDQDGAHELIRIPSRQLVREANDRDGVDAAAVERLETLVLRHQQRRRLVGPHHPRWMRVEGHRHRGAAMLGGAATDALDDLEMSAMKAVEVAEGEHGMDQPRGWRVVWKVKNLHAYATSTSMSSTRPSYASCTPSGSRA